MDTDKLTLQSPNLVRENIERIAALFPNCVTETANGKAIDFDLLKQELSTNIVDGLKERYRLEWPGKREAIVTANIPTTKTLRPIKADSVDFDNTQNLYIEGDNLEVLKLLQESYLGKIKMIYIDPPYNTGNDFVYKDNFAVGSDKYDAMSGNKDETGQRMFTNPETSGRYHSDWLTMIYPRLKLARNLLTDDGVIFISIDDNEVHNLRKVCDEIFGETNFVAQFIWEKKYTTSNNIIGVSNVHEYILCFCKNSLFTEAAISRLDYSKEALDRYKNPDSDFRGNWMDVSYHGPKSPSERPNLNYAIIHPKTGEEIWPKEKCWAYEYSVYEKHVEENRLWWGKDFTYSEPRLKKFISEMQGGMIPKSLLINKDVGGTSVGRDNLRSIFSENASAIFDNPKPISLIKKILNIGASNESDIVLDFFSGSATTAHAVMQLNSEDGGNRKFIMVQVPEATDEKSEAFKAEYKNICEIGKERIRRAGKVISGQLLVVSEKKEQILDFEQDTHLTTNNSPLTTDEANNSPLTTKIDIGFRVYRLDSSNMQDVYYKPQDYKQENIELFASNIKPDRTPEDLLTQVMLSWCLPLHYKIETIDIQGKQVFKVAEDSLFACFENGIDEAFAKEIANHQPLRVVFNDASFQDDTAKENVKQLLKQLSPNTEMKVI